MASDARPPSPGHQPGTPSATGLQDGVEDGREGLRDGTDGPDRPRSLTSRLFRVLAGLAIAASFGVWVYAYSGRADRPPPDLLIDTQLAAQAETICASAVADVAAMPSAQDAVDEIDRADQVHRTTDRFDAMVADLARLDVVEPDDQVIMTGWLGDWRVLLEDRRRYAREVVEDPDAVFLLTKVAERERLDRRLTRVADVNRMSSCGTPTDVG